jgi:hypothetical protein
MGLAWRTQDYRLLRLETMLSERDARWASRLEHLDEALKTRKVVPQGNTSGTNPSASADTKTTAKAPEPTVLALARIEARLGELGERLREAQPTQNPTDPGIDELRRDLERLRKDFEARAQSSGQESRELSMAVQEVLQLLRRLAMSPSGPGLMQFPVPEPLHERQRRINQGSGLIPGLGPFPGQAQAPDQDHSFMDPAQGYRERSSQGYPGSFGGPRMQRPGGPG